MPVRLRSFTDDDWSEWVGIRNAVYPEHAESVEEAKASAAAWDQKMFRSWLVAETDEGQVIGRGIVAHLPEEFHPDRYEMTVEVHPDHRCRGYGTRIYNHQIAELQLRAAESVRVDVKDDDTPSKTFATARAFEEVLREWESRLDLATFDPSPFVGAMERVAASGIRLTTLAAERDRRPDAIQAAHALYNLCNRDVPAVDSVTDLGFDQFVGLVVNHPAALLDGYFLARDGERFVGQSNLSKSTDDHGVIYQGLTGVLREYRGHGIAMALKLETVRYAREHGKREIRTWNDTRNRAMLRINEAMGFVKQPAWLTLLKPLRDGSNR